MGRNKISIQKIKDERIRNITYYKRKKGLVKKAMELSLLCDADILVCVYPKHIAYRQLLIFSTTNNADSFIDKYIKNPLIKKEIFGLKDYGALFTNNILNPEQVKQINDIENDNNDKMEKVINISNNNIFNSDKNKINFVGPPTFCNFNKENKIINEPFGFKNLFKSININNNTEQNFLTSNNKINNFEHLIKNEKIENKEKIEEKIGKKEDNSNDENNLNLPKIPSFLNDKIDEIRTQKNEFTNINKNTFNNNMINISNIHNLLFNNIFNKDFKNNLFSQDINKNLYQILSANCQIPGNLLFNNYSNNNLYKLNLFNFPKDKDIFKTKLPTLNFPLYSTNKINNNNNKNEHIFNIFNIKNSDNNSFIGQKRFKSNIDS